MLTYDLKVGYSCNNKCLHCVIADSKNDIEHIGLPVDLNTEECLELINDASKIGAQKIILTGGEITLRNDFTLLLSKCVELNMCVGLQTNGRMLTNKDILNAISSVNDITCIIAIHGSDSNVHDSITQRNGSFDETISGISSIINIHKKVIGKVVISKINMNQLSSIVKLLSSLGVNHVNFAYPHVQGGARANFEAVVPRYSELRVYLYQTIQTAIEYNVKIEFEAIPFCIIPKYPMLVGELQYLKSNKTVFTQVRESTEDWNDIRIKIKQKSPKCQNCFYNEICEGPWSEYILYFGDDDILPISFSNDEKAQLIKIISQIKG